MDARLRRLCERKPSGRLNVPESVHNAWAAGGTSRDELRMLLEQYDFDKDGPHGLVYIYIFLFLYISIYLYILLYIYISCIISIYRAVYLSNVTSLYFRTQLGQKLFTISFHIGLSIYIYTYVPSIYICKNLLNTIRYTWGTSSLTVSPEDKFVNSVTKMIERKNEDQQEVKSGWFTPAQMKTELKWDQPLYSVIGSSILAYSV